MTLSIRPDINYAAQVLPSLSTQQLPIVTEADAVYIEWRFYLELVSVAQLLDNLTYRTVAVLPSNLKDLENVRNWVD